MERLYLDYAASTPVDPQVMAAMEPYFTEKFGNPGSLHSFGQEAIAAVDAARETIAEAIGADFREIIFIGSATEANNIALRGVAKHAMQMTRIHENAANEYKSNSYHSNAFVDSHRVSMIVSSVEHESVLETARDLEHDGVEVVIVPVDRSGVVDLKKLETALDERTILVSVMYVNNEVGTVQPIAKTSDIIRNFKEERGKRKEESVSYSSLSSPHFPLLHTDAAQAFQFLDCDVNKLGVDLMTISSHKIYGPKGVGVLYVRGPRTESGGASAKKLSSTRFPLSPTITGGGQEFGLRSGTENVPLIVGFAKAVELAVNLRESESKRINDLKNYFWMKLKEIVPDAEQNGAVAAPHILNVYFPGLEAQTLIEKFDLAGIAVSAGSACRARTAQPSYVIEALGSTREPAESSIRFSLGRPTTKEEIDKMLELIKNRKLLS